MTPPPGLGADERAAEAEPYARVMLRPIATPLTVGFLALAVASFVMAGLELSWVDPIADGNAVGLAVLCFAVPTQLVAAVYGFLARDVVASTGMAVLAGTWLAVGGLTFTGVPGRPSGALGLLLVAAGAALVVPAVVGLSSKVVASAVLFMASLRFLVTGAYELSGSAGWQTAAGALGLATSLVALYAAAAYELESAKRRTILPTGRRGRGRVSVAGHFTDEIDGIQHEAGVRQQL